MTKWKWISLLVVVILAAGITWAYWPDAQEDELDPKLAPIEQQMKKLRDPSLKLSEQERSTLREEVHQQIESLEPEERRELFASRRREFRQRMQNRLDEFFEAPPEQRTAVLDRHIREMEQRRREFERTRAQGVGPPFGGFGPGRGGFPGAGGRGPAGGGPPGQGPTEEQRNQRRRRLLDNTTPRERAQVTEYFREVQQRRKELGLPERPFGPPRPGRSVRAVLNRKMPIAPQLGRDGSTGCPESVS
jgi:hypothetical protein